MEPESDAIASARLIAAIPKLNSHGFSQLDGWLFAKGYRVYDFSAADLNQIARIERDGLFVTGHLEYHTDDRSFGNHV